MKMRIAICDDELLERKLMEKLLERALAECGTSAELLFYSSADECVTAMEHMQDAIPDVFFLDIYMEGQYNGIRLAQKLRDMGSDARIIFITGGNEYASEAFEVGAFHYLQKPIQYEKFRSLVERLCRSYQVKRTLDIVVDRETKRIFLADILRIETMNRKLTFYTKEREYETYMSLREVLSILPEAEFVKISRFAAVALDKIRELDSKGIVLVDGTELPLSEKYYTDVKRDYESFRERRREER